MTKEEIMQMDERELYESILWFLNPQNGPWGGDDVRRYNDALEMIDRQDKALFLCREAEDKLEKLGDDIWKKYGEELEKQTRYHLGKLPFLSDIAHAHPRDRARAILMTIGEKL